MSDFKPLLAKDYDPAKLVYPVYASPKLDGIRGSVVGGKLLSRSLKPIPNKHVYDLLSDPAFEGFDGELIAGSPTSPDAMREATSFFMSHNKVQPFSYYVFDLHDMAVGFESRNAQLKARHAAATAEILNRRMVDGVKIVHLPQTLIRSDAELIEFEERQIGFGYEGVILRAVHGVYKYGRSTVNEGILLKVKRFTDGEATIVGFEEQMHNGNEATTNELGRTKRSSHKENKHGKGTLGALVVRDLVSGIEFNIGTGMNDGVREFIWANRDDHAGKIVKYKSFEVGVKDKPRHPVYLGLRSSLDMSV